MARTIINGVSNNARVETIKENSDVIDGVKFLGTLDGKTCPYCASLDGYIWRGEEMGQARRPPIHPNCRCTLIPYVELKDDEGNVVEVDSERPAANADFDQLAKEAYDDNARQNGWQRRWDDLAPSTRLKYYYQAQKDFEAQTGKKAYEQVPASLTFADYFKKQDDQFKRSWLGAKRFELYKDGKLKEDQIFAPNLGYMATAKELFHISKETQQTAEELAELAKELRKKRKESSNANTDEAEKNRTTFFDRHFPAHPNSSNREFASSLVPSEEFVDSKTTYKQNAKVGVEKGLDAIARMCDRYNIDLREVGGLTFEKEIAKRGGYDPNKNKITLDKRKNINGKDGSIATVVHEIGHAIETNCFGKRLDGEIRAFYESVSLIDKNGRIQYQNCTDRDDGQRFRVLGIKVPHLYVTKEYVNSQNKLESTEFLSMFFQTLYERPANLTNPEFEEYYKGIEKCIERARELARKDNEPN